MNDPISPRARLATHPKVKAALVAVEAEREKFAATMTSLESLLQPELAIQNAKAAVYEASDAAALAKACAVLSALDSKAVEHGRVRAMHLARAAFEPFKASVALLLNVGADVVNELVAEAEDAEASLFSAAGMQREATGVSRRVRDLGVTIQSWRETLSPSPFQATAHWVPRPNALNHIVQFFL